MALKESLIAKVQSCFLLSPNKSFEFLVYLPLFNLMSIRVALLYQVLDHYCLQRFVWVLYQVLAALCPKILVSTGSAWGGVPCLIPSERKNGAFVSTEFTWLWLQRQNVNWRNVQSSLHATFNLLAKFSQSWWMFMEVCAHTGVGDFDPNVFTRATHQNVALLE